MALSGMDTTGGAMFNLAGGIGGGPVFGGRSPGPGAPTAEEMEQARQAALFNKLVVFQKIEIRTFDLGIPEEALEYATTLKMLFAGVQTKTHMILLHDKKFVEQPKPRWIGHLEWAEYELKVTANDVLPPAPVLEEKRKNGKASAQS